MKATHVLAFMGLTMLTGVASAEEKAISIQGKDGKTIQAEVLSADDDSVKIRRADGKEFDLPFARLSDDSAKVIRELIAARKKAATDEAAAKDAAKPAVRAAVPKDPKSPEEILEKVAVKKGGNVIATFSQAVDGLAKPVIVAKEPENAPFFRVNFVQEGDQTIVTVTSTYEKTVLVRCLARDKDQQGWYTTTILPLAKGVPSFETWGAEVEELVFFDFRFEEQKAEDKPAEEPEAKPEEKPQE